MWVNTKRSGNSLFDGRVYQVNDISGNNRHLVSGGGGSVRPYWIGGSTPSVLFSGGQALRDLSLSNNAFLSNDSYSTIIIVAKMNADSSGFNTLVSTINRLNFGAVCYYNSSNYCIHVNRTAGNSTLSNTKTNAVSKAIECYTFEKRDSTVPVNKRSTIMYNFDNPSENNATSWPYSPSNGSSALCVGAQSSGTNFSPNVFNLFASMNLYELIIIKSGMTDYQKSKLKQYINNEWGI